MLGRGHAISGAVGYLAVAAPAGLPTDPQLLAAGTLLCAAALAPDLDHPRSTLPRFDGAVTQTASGVVSATAGGHRQLTHSLASVAIVTAAATWLTRLPSTRAAAIVAGLLVAAAAPLLAASLGSTRLIGPALAGCARSPAAAAIRRHASDAARTPLDQPTLRRLVAYGLDPAAIAAATDTPLDDVHDATNRWASNLADRRSRTARLHDRDWLAARLREGWTRQQIAEASCSLAADVVAALDHHNLDHEELD